MIETDNTTRETCFVYLQGISQTHEIFECGVVRNENLQSLLLDCIKSGKFVKIVIWL